MYKIYLFIYLINNCYILDKLRITYLFIYFIEANIFFLFTVKIDKLQIFLSFLSSNNKLKKLNKINRNLILFCFLLFGTNLIHPDHFHFL
jgi:hypothetical protein